MFGLLNVDKPPGMTSREVVNHIQRIVRPHKAGHAGTLDPLATGVVVVCVGKATRLIEYVQRQAKAYRGTFLLGKRSDTEDIEGDVVDCNGSRPNEKLVQDALPLFVGDIQQRPPAYSALKVNGKRAYALARAGEPVELPPRPITVYGIELVSYDYPELTLDIRCGAGTYIRSLGRDIALKLETNAVMSALVRTAVGPFVLPQATALESITSESISASLLSPMLAVSELPKVQLDDQQIECVRRGQTILAPLNMASTTSELVATDGAGNLIAILRGKSGNQFGPSKNFCDVS